jgi:hypothetical protein
MKYCFKVGLYQQGLLHDLSKYSPTEFIVGIKHYQGTESPNNAERLKIGYSSAWLHHKGRNKHHFEYWIDYSIIKGEGMVGMKMPVRYVVEMFIDRMCASKNYNKDTYTDKDPYDYYVRGKHAHLMHKDTRELLEKLLIMLAKDGEEKTLQYIKNVVLKRGY